MKKVIAILVLLVGIISAQEPKTTETKGTELPLPTTSGVYIQTPVKFESMLPMPVGGAHANVVGSAFSFGVASPKISWKFQGEKAPVQLSNSKPTFLVVHMVALNPRALQIVKLDAKKGHREMRITHGATSFNTTAGLPDAEYPLEVKQVADGVYSVTVLKELPVGEYALFNGMVFTQGYDFGVIAAK
jgi:hypothetical protein